MAVGCSSTRTTTLVGEASPFCVELQIESDQTYVITVENRSNETVFVYDNFSDATSPRSGTSLGAPLVVRVADSNGKQINSSVPGMDGWWTNFILESTTLPSPIPTKAMTPSSTLTATGALNDTVRFDNKLDLRGKKISFRAGFFQIVEGQPRYVSLPLGDYLYP